METKQYLVTYRTEVKRCGTIEATSLEEARKKFDNGDYDEGHDVDCYGIDDVCISEASE